MSTATELAPAQLATRLWDADESLYLLDVRREDEYEAWHIDGTANLPVYDQLLDGDVSGLEPNLDDLPEDREIVVVCVAGITSTRAAAFLREQGYNATSLDGGMREWGRLHVSFSIDRVDGLIQILRPGTGCLSYLVHANGEGAIIDPSLYTDIYLDVAEERNIELTVSIDTHAHADHLSGGRLLASELDIPYYLHPADGGALAEHEYTPMRDDDSIAVGDAGLTVHGTPGHTPGSASLTWKNALLSGDTLFIESVGRPDLEGSEESEIRQAAEELYRSLNDFREFANETVVVPGHVSDGDLRPVSTTLGQLETDNELFGMESGEAFVDTIIKGLSDEPANYNRIKAINWGKEPLTDDAADLELGPNNCAAN